MTTNIIKSNTQSIVEPTTSNGKLYTTREVAEQLGISERTVQRNVHNALPNKVITARKAITFTEAEATLLLDYMQKHNNRSDLATTTVVAGASTSLTPALKFIGVIIF